MSKKGFDLMLERKEIVRQAQETEGEKRRQLEAKAERLFEQAKREGLTSEEIQALAML